MPYPAINKDLTTYIFATIAADATIRAAVGGGASPFLFWYYQAPARLPGTEILSAPGVSGYISFAQLSAGRERGGVTEPVFSFRIYSYRLATVLDIETRLRTVFDLKIHTIVGSTKSTTQVVHSQDLFDQTSKFAGRELHIAFGTLTATV